MEKMTSREEIEKRFRENPWMWVAWNVIWGEDNPALRNVKISAIKNVCKTMQDRFPNDGYDVNAARVVWHFESKERNNV